MCIVYSIFCLLYTMYIHIRNAEEYMNLYYQVRKLGSFFLLQDTVTEQREFVEKTAKLLIKM